MASENRRVIVVSKKQHCSEQDDYLKAAMPGDPDPTSTDRLTNPINMITDRFTTPLNDTTDIFTHPFKESTSRFSSHLDESTHRFTAPLKPSSDKFTTPLRESFDKNRGRNSNKFNSNKYNDPCEMTAPPSRDRSPHKYSHKFKPMIPGRNETEPEKRSHPSDYDRRRRGSPPLKDRQLSPPRDSYDNFRDDGNRNHSSDYYRRNGPPPSKDRRLSPSRDSYDKFREDSNRNHPSDYHRRRNESPPLKDRRLSPPRDSYNDFRDDSNRNHSPDYYRRRSRSPPPLKERRLSPPRDSYNFKDGNRHTPYNSTYDKDDFNNQQSSHAKNIISDLDVRKRPLLDATILITSFQLRKYAEQIERRLKNINMTTEIVVVYPSQRNEAVENSAKEGVLYVIIVNSLNKAHHSLTLHIFQGTPQEHRNMPSDDAMSLVARNFERYLQVLKEQNAGHAAIAAPPPPPSNPPPPPPPPHSVQSMAQPQTATTQSSHPPPNPDPTSPNQPGLPFLPPSSEISYLFNLLADCRHLTLQELDKVLDYLKERKREFLEMSQTNAPKGAGDFSSGDDLQRMDKNHLMSTAPPKIDYQSQILSMIMPSNMSDNKNLLQQNVHNLPGQPMRSMDLIPKDDQGLQSVDANNSSNMTALINFDNPSVKRALDNLIQIGPSLLQNINAVSKNTNVQQLPPNTSMDRNQVNYNRYGIPQSMDQSGPQMMSHMGRGGGRGRVQGGHGDVHPNMGMNTGMNRDPIGHTPPHFNRGSGMFPNNPHMMNRGPSGPMPGPGNDQHPQQY